MAHRLADFPAKVRRLIAERAGYLCSKPDCRRQTLGPGTGPLETACIGVACHIYSASPGGPRGSGGLMAEQLQSASNGIWLCADHARLIDTSGGLSYPAPLLRGWRQLHEAFLRHEMRGLVPPCALITEVIVRQGPEALTARPVALSTHNIITGPNSTGKSVFLDLLARAGRGSPACRPWHGELAADIHWFDPQPHLLQLSADESGTELLHDSRRAPSAAAPYATVTVRPPRGPYPRLNDWADLLGLDQRTFIDVLRDVPQCVRGEVSQVDITDGIPEVRLRSLPDPVRLDGDSSGWGTLVLLETAIALAQMYSLKGPALLLVDDFGDCLHPLVTRKLLALLASATRGFQTVVVTHQVLTAEIMREWAVTAIGWDGSDLFPETARLP